MTYWLDIETTGADSLVVGHVQDRVDRAFDGGKWLRQRFGATRTVELRMVATAAPVASAGGAAKLGGHRRRLVAEVRVPAVWFPGTWAVDAGSGLLGFRLMGATLLGLDAIGAEFGLGPCPLRTPGTRLRREQQLDCTEDDALEAAVDRLTAALPPGRLLLVAGDEADEDRPWHRAVAARLAATPVTDAEVPAWMT
ncbi:hypothetical protein ACFPIJ_04985 [Dactylosporangium cerinum]|uniref:Uncharacterized protein n=1 Tax=Dactylosporangium cerinum TaxID=1434730 RepID=A0ABV9VLC5_9ACTN